MKLVRDRWVGEEFGDEPLTKSSIANWMPKWLVKMLNFDNSFITDEKDESEWWACTGKNVCFGNDYPLIRHGIGGNLKSSPGDSWSLTWLK